MEASAQRSTYGIRWMVRRDMPEVLAIESDAFEWDAWRESEFIACLRQRNAIGMVIERAGISAPLNSDTSTDRVLGYMIYELHKTRLELINIAVRLSHRRQGLGSEMISKLIGKLSLQRRRSIVTIVRESNLPGQQFFASHGFRAGCILQDQFDDCDEDAYMFRYRVKNQPQC